MPTAATAFRNSGIGSPIGRPMIRTPGDLFRLAWSYGGPASRALEPISRSSYDKSRLLQGGDCALPVQASPQLFAGNPPGVLGGMVPDSAQGVVRKVHDGTFSCMSQR